MRLLSTSDERTALLQRLSSAPNTPEIQSAIRIVEEAMEFAEMRQLIVRLFESPECPSKFEDMFSDDWTHHVLHRNMRDVSDYIDDLYENTRLQRFKSFWSGQDSDIDDDGWQRI